MYNPDIHHRQSIRLREYDYSCAGAYFITVCVHERECLFGDISDGAMTLNEAGRMVESVWQTLPKRFPYAKLDEFRLMPNHFHGIIVINDDANIVGVGAIDVGAIHELPLRVQRRKMLIPKIIGYFKMNTAKQINIIRDNPGVPVWQRNYYERIIRDEEELASVREYIAANPMQWAEDKESPDIT